MKVLRIPEKKKESHAQFIDLFEESVAAQVMLNRKRLYYDGEPDKGIMKTANAIDGIILALICGPVASVGQASRLPVPGPSRPPSQIEFL